ncbi:toll/interleukin-1 receptor domain-containing protein [Labedaea rhizosphaerae]|nr:toll/interleukin-1 receptor domain-containing protein [Labedaea rhizosphaerae]
MSAEPPIKCFISYARADDTVMRFVDQFAAQLAHFAFADRNRQVEPFIDHESVGWGEEWTPRIQASLAQAAVFMPIVTRQYFDRQACRDELLTYHNEAKGLGVQSLVLPVVVLGHSYLTEENADPAARIIADRQYRDFREAWIEGPNSPVWRRELVRLANDLVTVVENAERTLASMPNGTGAVCLPDDRPGSIELGEATERMVAEAGPIAMRINATMEHLGQVLTERSAGLAHLEGDQARQAIRDTAAAIEPLGREFESGAAELQQVVFETDAVFRGYVAHLLETGTAAEIEEARSSLAEARGELDSLQEVQEAVALFLEQLRPLELASAPMRLAFRPLRTGAGSIATAVGLIRRWPDMLSETAAPAR